MKLFCRHSFNSTFKKYLAGGAYLPLIFLFCLMGCNRSGPQGSGAQNDLIAEYDGHNLYRQELDAYNPAKDSSADSAFYAQKYIDNWLMQQAISERARAVIKDLPNRTQLRKEVFERQLLNHEFTEWLISNELDVRITEDEARNYYTTNKGTFVSKSNYYVYFHVSTEESGQNQVLAWMKSKDPDKIEEMLQWAGENASAYSLDSSYVTDLEIKRIAKGSKTNLSKARIGRAFKFYHKEGGTGYYHFFKMLNIVRPGQALPYKICRDKIMTILLNERKKELVESTEFQLYEQAKASPKFSVYY